jgi:hypothetical protein
MTSPQLPTHLQRFQARDIGQTLSHNLGTAAPPYVSIAGNRFSLIDAAGNERMVSTFDAGQPGVPGIGQYLDACIIDANEHLSRIYYAQKYDPSAATFNPPDCWSDNGVGPSVSCSAPQARSCTPDPEHQHGCKWAVWGSATSNQGKAVPACQQVQKIALMVPGIPQTIFLLRVPPNSHKHLRAYQETCKGSGVMVADVITRIYFDQTTQGTLLFKGVSYIDEPTAVLRETAYNEKKTDALVGRTDAPRQLLAQVAAPVQLMHSGPTQAISPASGPVGYVPPGPLATQVPFTLAPAATAPVQTAQSAAPMATGVAFATQPASSTEPAPAQRRRRRTAAEMAASAPQGPNGQAPQQPAAAPVAPFPHPASQVATPGMPAGQQPQFGIAQGQPANPELATMLDDFFKQG